MQKRIFEIQQVKQTPKLKNSRQKKSKMISKKAGPTLIRKMVVEKTAAKRKNLTKILKKRREHHFKLELKNMIRADNVNCPICLQIMVGPILTECGHTFCLRCIQDAKFMNDQCPICRKSLENQTFQQSKQIKNLINIFVVQNLSQQEQKIYLQKSQSLQELQRKRKLPQCLKKYDFIDFNYKQKWIQAQVLELYNTFLIVGVSRKGEKLQKIKVYLRERRIANFRTFTSPPARPTFSLQKPKPTSQILPLLTETDNLQPIVANRPFPPPQNQLLTQQFAESGWDFELLRDNPNGWINEEADMNLPINLWDPIDEGNELSLFA